MAKASLGRSSTPTVEEQSAIDIENEVEDQTPAPEPMEQRMEPMSTPPAAGAVPATMLSAPQPAAPKKQTTAQQAVRPSCPIPNDRAQFPSMSDEQAAEATREVRCQIIAELKGCLGLTCQFHFMRGQVLLLPKWFAVSYPKNIVIKE